MWLKNWRLTLNGKKSKVVHFRPKSVKQVEHNFHCGPIDIDLAKTYTYLGFPFHGHNDLTVGAQALAQSASKALSALLCKTRNFGGLGFATYSELFHTGIASILDYGGGVWGYKKQLVSITYSIKGNPCLFRGWKIYAHSCPGLPNGLD